MVRDCRIKDAFPDGLEPLQRAFLILLAETAEFDHISRKDRCKAALH